MLPEYTRSPDVTRGSFSSGTQSVCRGYIMTVQMTQKTEKENWLSVISTQSLLYFSSSNTRRKNSCEREPAEHLVFTSGWDFSSCEGWFFTACFTELRSLWFLPSGTMECSSETILSPNPREHSSLPIKKKYKEVLASASHLWGCRHWKRWKPQTQGASVELLSIAQECWK